ncbi:MAG: hypothetical protein CMM93_09175 [Rickettsiales bacterium]|nr:hypothetical protein [Rickettsiales bacterium]|tara:strand:- start:1064 stop:1447 length:384 start_codon:yes stop_codon:yes gene_type:complete
MSDWQTRAFSNNSTPVELSDEILDQEGVIFLTGKNTFGDDVYSYLKITIRNIQRLKEALAKGEHFMPSDFGSVLAAGKGEPDQELRSEMAVTYKLIDVPQSHRKVLQPEKPAMASMDTGGSADNFWE